VKKIAGGVTAPKGFRASGAAAGIKPGSTKLDCALIVCDVDATIAGTFTTNLFKSPAARWSESIAKNGKARAVFINSGNANTCTGAQGREATQKTADAIAQRLGVLSSDVCVCSTGVIGVQLPMERILQGTEHCFAALSATGGGDAARAIMTTDTVPKETAIEVVLSGGPVRIGAMAKGAGMIAPNMATMISVVTTDATITAENLRALLKHAAESSFNRVCIDNDMSTSDTLLCFASGRSGSGSLIPSTADYDAFAAALVAVCQEMAQALVRDGEGATKFVEIQVSGANTDDDAKTLARAIAFSQLVKTAFFGKDPNWGRIACAAGYAGVAFNPDQTSIWIGDVQVMRDGAATAYAEADAAAVMREAAFCIKISVGNGPGTCVFWTSDLSYDYVKINADYRS
jgi:glutamate N-acetyltransferase/amino-acid N-acetyltransferase